MTPILAISAALAASAASALSHLSPVSFAIANLQMPCAVAVFHVEKICSSPNMILWTLNSPPYVPHSKPDQTNGCAIHGGKVGT